MTTVLNPPKVIAEERFVLHNVTWETYEQLLRNYQDSSAPHFTYDQGDLEIMSPSIPHEEASEILKLFVSIICEERELDFRSLGSTTHKLQHLLKGAEPDGCFYIESVDAMRGVREFDLTRHPPPDLVIEVDITSPSIANFPIYLAFGVPEIWHFKDERVRFFRLAQGNYVSVNESMPLPSITAEAVTRFLIAATDMKRPDWLREVRQYVRSIKES